MLTSAALALFTLAGCNLNPAVPPTVSLSIENGSTEIDPAQVPYIDVKFSNSMDTNYSGYIYYGQIKYDLGDQYWVNSYTYRVYFNLRYGQDYKIVFNDSSYAIDYPDYKKTGFFRDKDGTCIKELSIEFSTIPSTLQHPHDFVIDFTKIQSFAASFADNSKNAPNTQQLLIFLNDWLNHEVLQKGDTLTVKYKLSSLYDIPKIKANLVETDDYVKDYWVKLSNDEDLIAVENYDSSEDAENPNYYEGQIKFTLSKDMYATAAVQLWADYNVDDDLISFESVTVEE